MKKYLILANRIILGLLMLVPGLMKFFALISEGVAEIIPTFWAWILIILEVIFGLAIIANYKLKYAVIPPVIILLVAILTMNIGNVSQILLHLIAIIGYLMLAYKK